MANTYIVSDSQFKPYTFDEMIKPALMYKQAYEDTEKKLESLEELGIDENSFLEQDTASKDLYNSYMTKLKETADALSQGYNAEVAKQARDLQRMFKTKINPIKHKMAIRTALTEEQRKAKLNNPYLIFDKDYADASLDEISENSTYDTLDLAKVGTEITKDMTKFIASKTPHFSQSDIAGLGTLITTTYGWSPDKVEKELQTPNSELSKKIQEYKTKYHNDKFSNNQNYIDAFIENAVKSNAGVSESQFIKGSTSKTGDWIYSGDKAYYVNDNGTIQLEGDYNSTTGEKSNLKPFNGAGNKTIINGYSLDDVHKMLSSLDESKVYSITSNGFEDVESLDSFLKNEDVGYLRTGSYVKNFDSLPESIKIKVKNYPSGFVNVKYWGHTSDSQGRYVLEKNYMGTGIQWKDSSSTPSNKEEKPIIDIKGIKI